MEKYFLLLFFYLHVSVIFSQGINYIPDQYASTGVFDDLDLDDYIVNTGTCYDLTLTPVSYPGFEDGLPVLPSNEATGFRENMTVTMKIKYAGFEFQTHVDDQVWVLDTAGLVVELNTSYVDPFIPEGNLLFLNVNGNFENYDARLIFYSGRLEKHIVIENAFEYGSNLVLGSPLEPYVIDVAPLIFEFTDNVISTTNVDSNYIDGLCLTAQSIDCDGQLLDDETFCFIVV